MRFGKRIRLRIPLTRQPVYYRSSGIAQPHHFGTLVDGFACRVVYRLPQHFHVIIGFHQNDLGIAATYQQAQERKFRLVMVALIFFNKMRQYMSLQMIDLYHGNTECACKSFGKRHPHQQRAHQSGTSRESHSRKLLLGHSGAFQRLVHHRNYILLMSTGSQFRHHPAIRLMHGLASCHVTQQYPVANHRCRRIITTRLYT